MKQDPLNEPKQIIAIKIIKKWHYEIILRREIHLCREVKKGKDKKRVEV